jgi:hypothetical protein
MNKVIFFLVIVLDIDAKIIAIGIIRAISMNTNHLPGRKAFKFKKVLANTNITTPHPYKVSDSDRFLFKIIKEPIIAKKIETYVDSHLIPIVVKSSVTVDSGAC